MAAADRTLLNVVQAVSARVKNFRAYVDTVENPDESMKNMVEAVNCVIRKMCRVKPSPMLNATFMTSIHDNVTAGNIEDINTSGIVDGDGSTTFTDIYTLRGSYASPDTYNAVLYVTDSTGTLATEIAPLNAPLRVSSISDNDGLSVSGYWPSGWDAIGPDTYEYSLCEDRITMPSDFSRLISASIFRKAGSTVTNTVLEPKRMSEMEYIRNTIGSGGDLADVYQIGTPVYVSLYADMSTGRYKLQFYPLPNNQFGLRVNYIRAHQYISSNSDYVMIPDADIDVLISGVEALWNSFSKEGYESAYEAWEMSVLRNWAGLKAARTDALPPRIRQREEDPLSRMRF